ncbi:hypothetical protein HDV06_005124 [Boothiomyces sp. JEL0866]|nr:hypothetical protein HDV06_005124 [Boothiomyces sp. JEL0866]
MRSNPGGTFFTKKIMEEALHEFILNCRYGEEREALEYLETVQDKGQLITTFLSDQCPLFMAAANGHVNILTHLVKHLTPQQVNLPNSQGSRALHWAALNGQLECVKLLLQFGANPLLRDNSGKSPATLAEQGEHLEVAKILLESYDPEQDEVDTEDVVVSSEDPEYREYEKQAEQDYSS